MPDRSAVRKNADYGSLTFMYGYVVAGLLVLAVSVALVQNAEAHRRRADGLAREAGRD